MGTLPCSFILFDIDHGVFDCFVHERVHTGDEEVDGSQQRLSVFGQQLLGFSVVSKLLLKRTGTIICVYCTKLKFKHTGLSCDLPQI